MRDGNRLIVASASLFVLLCQGSGTGLSAQELLTCNLPPLNGRCEAVLPLGQDSLQLSVRVNLPQAAASTPRLTITTPTSNTAEVAIAAASVDPPRVTISSTHCCVHPQVATVDRNGYVSLTWRGPRPETPVEMLFAAVDGRDLRIDTVRITAQAAPKKSAPLAVYTTPYHGTVPRYVWIRGDHVPVTIPVSIDDIGGGVPIDTTPEARRARLRRARQRCDQVRVVFTALQGGKVSPDSVQAIWHPRRTAERWDSIEGRCLAETRWRLADDAGEQQMNVLVGGDSIARSRFTVTAFARHAPRLIGGYGYFAGLRQDRDVTCAEIRSSSRCTDRPDSDTLTIQVREGGGSAYFAVEFPLFLRYQISEGAGVAKYLSEHLRIVLGSTFERPADNIFVGFAILPLLSGASEASPFQISAGFGSRGWKTRYIGMSLDASTIISPVLAAIGAK